VSLRKRREEAIEALEKAVREEAKAKAAARPIPPPPGQRPGREEMRKRLEENRVVPFTPPGRT